MLNEEIYKYIRVVLHKNNYFPHVQTYGNIFILVLTHFNTGTGILWSSQNVVG